MAYEKGQQLTDFFKDINPKNTKKKIALVSQKINDDFETINRLADEEEARLKALNNPADASCFAYSPSIESRKY